MHFDVLDLIAYLIHKPVVKVHLDVLKPYLILEAEGGGSVVEVHLDVLPGLVDQSSAKVQSRLKQTNKIIKNMNKN